MYMDFHYIDKSVTRPSNLYNGNPYIWKDGVYTKNGSGGIWDNTCTDNWHLHKMADIFAVQMHFLNEKYIT